MYRPGSAKGDYRNATEIDTHFDAVHSCCRGHVLVDNFVDTSGGVDH